MSVLTHHRTTEIKRSQKEKQMEIQTQNQDQAPNDYSHLEKQMAKYIKGLTVRCIANYALYAAAAFTVYLYADHMLSQVIYQISSH